MPSVDNIEEYFAAVEEYLQSSLNVVTRSLPDVNEVVNQLWVDIARYGPGMPGFSEVHVPAFADFQVSLPPPPPPPIEQSSWTTQSADWIARHPWKTTGVVASLVGVGVLIRHRDIFTKRAKHLYSGKKAAQAAERRQIIGKYCYIGHQCLYVLMDIAVVLGGDMPYALPLIQDLERKGYIVLASVSTPEAVDALEARSHGYVKAHVLDPFEVGLELVTYGLSFIASNSPRLFQSSSALFRLHFLANFHSILPAIPLYHLPLCPISTALFLSSHSLRQCRASMHH